MPLELNSLLLFGTLLLLGLLGSSVAHRSGKVPGITGMIAVGFIAGPGMLGLISEHMLMETRVFVDVALGLILFQLGLLLDVRAFFSERRTWMTAIAECVLTFGSVFAALNWLGISQLHSALASAVAVSSSPAVLLMVVKELKSSGVVTDLSLRLVAFNNIAAFFLYTAILPFVHVEQQVGWLHAIGAPLFQMAGSAALGVVLAFVLVKASRWLLPRGSDAFVLVVAVVLISLGMSKMLQISPLLALLALGLAVRNLDSPEHLREVEFGRGGDLFFLILFVFAGANLHLDHLVSAVLPAFIFVLARCSAKWVACLLVLRFHRLPSSASTTTGLTLVPMAGMAIGLVQSTAALYPDFTSALTALILGSIAILETIGPIATEWALKRAGEVNSDAAIHH